MGRGPHAKSKFDALLVALVKVYYEHMQKIAGKCIEARESNQCDFELILQKSSSSNRHSLITETDTARFDEASFV